MSIKYSACFLKDVRPQKNESVQEDSVTGHQQWRELLNLWARSPPLSSGDHPTCLNYDRINHPPTALIRVCDNINYPRQYHKASTTAPKLPSMSLRSHRKHNINLLTPADCKFLIMQSLIVSPLIPPRDWKTMNFRYLAATIARNERPNMAVNTIEHWPKRLPCLL